MAARTVEDCDQKTDYAFRIRIRAATAESHASLDKLLGRLDICHAPEYRKFLCAIASALVPLEAALTQAGAASVIPSWHRRLRSAAILSDLSQLNSTLTPMPIDFELNRPGILGAAYVLEGSRLGAKVLAKQVLDSSDPQVRSANLYLTHGENEHHWSSFISVLHRKIKTPIDEQQAISAAHKAFALFEIAAN